MASPSLPYCPDPLCLPAALLAAWSLAGLARPRIESKLKRQSPANFSGADRPLRKISRHPFPNLSITRPAHSLKFSMIGPFGPDRPLRKTSRFRSFTCKKRSRLLLQGSCLSSDLGTPQQSETFRGPEFHERAFRFRPSPTQQPEGGFPNLSKTRPAHALKFSMIGPFGPDRPLRKTSGPRSFTCKKRSRLLLQGGCLSSDLGTPQQSETFHGPEFHERAFRFRPSPTQQPEGGGGYPLPP